MIPGLLALSWTLRQVPEMSSLEGTRAIDRRNAASRRKTADPALLRQ